MVAIQWTPPPLGFLARRAPTAAVLAIAVLAASAGLPAASLAPSLLVAPVPADPRERQALLQAPPQPEQLIHGGVPQGFRSFLPSFLASLTLTAVVKGLCIFGNVLWQVSPWPQVFRWHHRGCTGDADAAPCLSIAFGGWQWCSYGALAYYFTRRSGFLILVQANVLGALLGTWYVFAFYRNCRNAASFESLRRYLGCVMGLVVFQVCAIAILPSVRALFLVGVVSSTCGFLGAFATLVTVPTVLRMQDSRSIPGPVVLAGFLCSNAWVACGMLLSDPLVTGPNLFAGSACGFCLYLKWCYPSSANLEDEDAAKAVDAFEGKLHGVEESCCASETSPLARAARLAASKQAALYYTKGEQAKSPPTSSHVSPVPSGAEPSEAECCFGETGGT